MTVLFHGDDLGITAGASRGMIAAWTAGALDGFSIIANGDAIETVREELAKHSGRAARIAVHFNLTEGRPSAPPDRVPLLLGPGGTFRGGFGSLFLRWLFGSAAARAALAEQAGIECRAQIQAVRALCGGRSIQAVDGHNHVHMIPNLFAAAAQAARAEGVPEIRVSREPFYLASPIDALKPFWWLNLIKHVLLRMLSRSAAPVARASGLRFPRFMVGVLYTGHMTGRRAQRGIEAAGGDDVEVVFHVGRSDEAEALRWKGLGRYASFHLSPRRTIEYEELLRLKATRPSGSSPSASP
jgi:predicted glycoside hydrolase/deacetylase ChbG (UPF0249 family)